MGNPVADSGFSQAVSLAAKLPACKLNLRWLQTDASRNAFHVSAQPLASFIFIGDQRHSKPLGARCRWRQERLERFRRTQMLTDRRWQEGLSVKPAPEPLTNTERSRMAAARVKQFVKRRGVHWAISRLATV